MDNVNLEDLLNDPNMLTKVRIMAHRERALATGAMLGSLAGAIKRVWRKMFAARPSAGQHAAHCA